MKFKVIITFLLVFIFGTLFLLIINSSSNKDYQPLSSVYSGLDAEYEKLLVVYKHAKPNSPEALQIEEKIKKIERRQSGRAKTDHPDEFVRILNEMKISSDEKAPSFRSGINFIWISKRNC